MGELFWDVEVGGRYKNDFVLQCNIWAHGIYYAQKHNYQRVHLNYFQNKVFHDFFKNSLVFESNSNKNNHKKISFRITSINEYKKYKLSLRYDNLFYNIKTTLINLQLSDFLQSYVNIFQPKSISVIDTRCMSSKSLKLNEKYDPELQKYNIMYAIPPGNSILVFKDNHQPDITNAFRDVYVILNLPEMDEHYKQCVELFLLFQNKVNFYYCSCPEYSTKLFF